MPVFESKVKQTECFPLHDRTADSTVLFGLYVLQKGRLRHVNDQTAVMLGYDDPAELIGKPFRALVVAEDLGSLRLNRSPAHAPPAAGSRTFRMLKKDGTAVRVSMQGDTAQYDGKPANIGCIVDMSAISRLEKALEKYRAMLNQVDDAVAEMDLNGNVIFSNTAVCRKWETLGDKSKTLNFRTYVDEGAIDTFIKAYKKVYDTGATGKHIVYTVKLANSQRLTVEDAVSPMRDDQGAITGFRVLSRNITDRKEAEKRLSRQRTQLQAIFRSVQDAIITVDPELRIVQTNRSAQTICGIDPQRAEGQTFSTSPPFCNRACLPLLRQTIDAQSRVKEHPVACGHRTNRQQTVNISASPLLDRLGQFIGAVMVIRDITQLKRMETQLHQRHQYQNIIARNETMKALLGTVKKVTRMETTVLITGESGTGKELFAKALHYSGPRAAAPFVSVNCAALNENLLESELFGHVRGAFTGAFRNKKGRFEAAAGGTLLLDEIGDISPLIQLKLLRVLQEKAFERVGEAASTKVDVRVIACTNKNLKDKIEKGQFRRDLYYRLNVLQIPLPPLRSRSEDIPLLADHFRNLFNRRHNKSILGISREAMERLLVYPWPGNVRELEHVIERACILCRGSEIHTEHLPAEMHGGRSTAWTGDRLFSAANDAQSIVDALRATQWNRARAARLLGISRQTLYRRIKAYRIIDNVHQEPLI